jgi:hypothetical protein
MHEMRSLYNRPANDDDFSDNWPVMYDPAFHYRLDHTVDHCSFHDWLHDLSFDNAALNDRTSDVALDDPTFDAQRFVFILNLDAAPNGSMVEIIIFDRIAATELRGGRSGGDYRGRRIGECGHTTDSEGLHNRA